MECNFDEITTTGKIVTKYHSIDISGKNTKLMKMNVVYGTLSVLGILSNHSTCYQSYDQLCQPWFQELYHVDKDGAGGMNTGCRCLHTNVTLNGFNALVLCFIYTLKY